MVPGGDRKEAVEPAGLGGSAEGGESAEAGGGASEGGYSEAFESVGAHDSLPLPDSGALPLSETRLQGDTAQSAAPALEGGRSAGVPSHLLGPEATQESSPTEVEAEEAGEPIPEP